VSGKYDRSERPDAQWSRYTYHEEAYRIISDKLWQATQARFKLQSNGDQRLKSGGKAVYRLSGLLKCGVCGRNYVIDGATHYACSGPRSGACTNTLRQRRDIAEQHILGAIDERLLDPKMVALMAKKIEQDFNKRLADLEHKATGRPDSSRGADQAAQGPGPGGRSGHGRR
jgi:hypothetical protein